LGYLVGDLDNICKKKRYVPSICTSAYVNTARAAIHCYNEYYAFTFMPAEFREHYLGHARTHCMVRKGANEVEIIFHNYRQSPAAAGAGYVSLECFEAAQAQLSDSVCIPLDRNLHSCVFQCVLKTVLAQHDGAL
jgi:hypothetical protein